MASSPLSVEVVRFGEYEVNLRSRELRRDGVTLRLPDQSFEVLVMLLERPGQLVTREEIHKRLWSADTFVDFDHGLNNAVNRLRDALGDSAEAPRFVETLPRRGYRFISEIEGTPHESEEVMHGDVPSGPLGVSQSSRSRRPVYRWVAIIIAGLCALATMVIWNGRSAQHPAIHSLAVLPFQNLSGDETQDYFADGMTDELITMLAKSTELRVISRTSVMRYKNVQQPLRQIAGELGADGILEGSIARHGNRVHVTAQLIHAASDTHVWAESYDRDLKDISPLQSEVARTIARQVGTTVSFPAHQEKPVNPEAYEAYLKARYFANIRGPAVGKAVEYYQLAIDKEPAFALAYAGLAESQWRSDDFTAAKRSARKALELDGTMGEPLATLAQIKAYNNWDFSGAEEDYKRAITLSPNYPPARQWYAQFLHWMGRLDEAMVQIEIGQQLDPLSLIMSTDRAEILLHMDQLDAATVQVKKVLELNPGFETAHFVLGEIYEREEKYDAALAEYKEGLRLTGQGRDYEAFSVATEARLSAEAGRTKEAAQLIARAERLLAKRPLPEPSGQLLASAYAALGDKNNAFLWLERDYAAHAPDLFTLKTVKEFDSLRNDPRFADLLKRVGFQQ
jgi:TolB-like protein/DNA-binding winged helix-turn-helix (wHTH) protein/Tfp pilus assembly protein PilF